LTKKIGSGEGKRGDEKKKEGTLQYKDLLERKNAHISRTLREGHKWRRP